MWKCSNKNEERAKCVAYICGHLTRHKSVREGGMRAGSGCGTLNAKAESVKLRKIEL